MNVYVEPSGRRLQPFDDPPDELPIQNRPLASWRAQAFRAAGLTPVATPMPPCLVVPDNLLASGGALAAFVAGAAGRNAVFVLKESRFGAATTPVQARVSRTEGGWRFEAIRFEDGSDAPPREVVVDPDEYVADLQLPGQYGSDSLPVGVPRHLVLTLDHWVHLLWANQVVGGVELRATPRVVVALRVLGAILRALSFNRWKILGKLNTMGRRCDIHPTACVEGSILGDGVVVGPFARVAFSRLGDGAVVMAGAQVEFSVVGARSLVADQCVVRSCVLYPEATASQLLMQQSILGHRAMTTKGSATLDLNFDQDIRVALDGRMRSTGLRFLGSAFGHRARVGTGIHLAPGRTIPNDYVLVRDPALICSVLPPGMPGTPLSASSAKAKPLAFAGLVRSTLPSEQA